MADFEKNFSTKKFLFTRVKVEILIIYGENTPYSFKIFEILVESSDFYSCYDLRDKILEKVDISLNLIKSIKFKADSYY